MVAAFFRLFDLEHNPPGFYSDEASFSYNAFSIIKTAKDEYGRGLPLVFEAFGDYKLPVMLYSIALSFSLFSSSEWSARLPGAIYGLLTVLFVFILVRQLLSLKTSTSSSDKITRQYLPVLSALVVALAPAHIFVSRGTWELTAALFFITAGSSALLKTVKELETNPRLSFKSIIVFLTAIILFALGLYSYNSARVFIPLFIIGIAILYRNQVVPLLKFNKLALMAGTVLTIVLLFPIITTMFSPQVTQRAKYISVFYDKGVDSKLFGAIRADGGQPVQFTRLLHNKPLFYFLDVSSRYLSHFDPNFLFTIGDTFEIFQIVGLGFLPLLGLPFLSLGTFHLCKNRPQWFGIMLIWLGISPLAASFTTYTPSSSRSMNMIVPLAIFTAYGLIQGYLWINMRIGYIASRLFTPIMLALTIINSAYIFNRYFIQTPRIVAEKWNDGYEETVDYVAKIEKNYDRIVVSSSKAPSYIFYLWNLRYSPQKYHQEVKVDHTPDEHGLNFTSQFGKYYFTKNISDEINKKTSNERVLYIAFSDEIKDYTKIIYSRNNKPVFFLKE
jgi:4-amino-4-deoxy-L-arabinose transferase-like glycosyltransferase